MNHLTRGKQRDSVRPGLWVDIIQKKDQRTGKLTRGRVKEVLTRSLSYPYGIKVRLQDGRVGRVAAVIEGKTEGETGGPENEQSGIPEDPADPGVQVNSIGIR